MSDYYVRPHPRDQRDPQTRNLRSRSSSRDMSWRKPVPKFLPSPPISPNQTQSAEETGSPTVTFFDHPGEGPNPFSMSWASLKNDLPPLPTDWKETIDRVTKNESTTNLRSLRTPPVSPIVTSPSHGFAHGYHHHHHTGVPQIPEEQVAFQEVDLGERKSRSHRRSAEKENVPLQNSHHGLKQLAASPGINESTVSIARIPKTYRPPTPPLPSRKRSSAPPTPVATTMSKPMHIVYPDLAGLGAETPSQRTKSPESDGTVETHTLRTARSSLTSWTNTRGPSMDVSTLAGDDDRTLSVYQPRSDVRKSASKTVLSAEQQGSGAGSLRSIGSWFDGFLGPFKSCISGY